MQHGSLPEYMFDLQFLERIEGIFYPVVQKSKGSIADLVYALHLQENKYVGKSSIACQAYMAINSHCAFQHDALALLCTIAPCHLFDDKL